MRSVFIIFVQLLFIAPYVRVHSIQNVFFYFTRRLMNVRLWSYLAEFFLEW